jgi:serine protease Do
MSGIIVVVAGGAGFGGAALFGFTHPGQTTTKQELSVTSSEADAIQKAIAKIGPSVVAINTTGTSSSSSSSFYDLFYGGGGQQQQTAGAATGIIISRDGYVLTNKHVVPNGTNTVSVVAADGTQYDNVQIVARDPTNDIAFLKIPNVDNLTPAIFSDSEPQVGQNVIAIGNALGQYQNTVTTGILSGAGRSITASLDDNTTETLTGLLQTDAAINPGNSGGPLMTYDGKIIGINTAIAQDSQGLGFAIPITQVRGAADQVIKTGKISRAYLGVVYVSLTASIAKQYDLTVNEGAYLAPDGNSSPVIADGPAGKAGLRSGDVITAIDGEKITASKTLGDIINTKQPNDKVKLTVLRGDQTVEISLTLGEYRQ